MKHVNAFDVVLGESYYEAWKSVVKVIVLCSVLGSIIIVWGCIVWSSGRFLECFTIAMAGVGCHIVRCTCKDELRYSCGERAEPRLRSWDVEQRDKGDAVQIECACI